MFTTILTLRDAALLRQDEHDDTPERRRSSVSTVGDDLPKKKQTKRPSLKRLRSSSPETSSPFCKVEIDRKLLLAVLLFCTFSFWAGRLVGISPSYQQQQQFHRISQSQPRLPLNGQWLSHDVDLACPTPVQIDVQTKEEESSDSHSKLEARIQYFSELVIHPTLLATERPVESVALVLDQDDDDSDEEDAMLLESLLEQLSLHQGLETVYLISEGDGVCPPAAASIDADIQVQCVSKEQLSRDIDAVFLLDDCDVVDDDDEALNEKEQDEDEDYKFWLTQLSSDVGTLVTCMGETLPFAHPQALQRFKEDREDMMPDGQHDEDDDHEDTPLAAFAKVIEYDLRLPSLQFEQTFATTIAVAMKNATSMAHWRVNAAHYNLVMHEREIDVSALQFFDSAAMLSLQYPSKHAAVYSCQHYIATTNGLSEDDIEDDVEFAREWCLQDNSHAPSSGNAHGYDPLTPNVFIDDLYIGKSGAGENAGRGVFTKRDVEEGSYVGLETTSNSVLSEWTTTHLHNDMHDLLPEAKQAHIVYVFAEAYGYSQDPWNKPQEAVMSHLLTFMNHGCNGTANMGHADDIANKWTELTVDLESGVVPEDFKTTVGIAYLPHFDRDQVKRETMCQAGRLIYAGEEMYDNYMSFGGDQYFHEMVEQLRQECSGMLGMVEQYQRKGGGTEKVPMLNVGKKDAALSLQQKK